MTGELTSALETDPRLAPRVPVATYRLQFQPAFAFPDACKVIPFLADFPIVLLIASPVEG